MRILLLCQKYTALARPRVHRLPILTGLCATLISMARPGRLPRLYGRSDPRHVLLEARMKRYEVGSRGGTSSCEVCL